MSISLRVTPEELDAIRSYANLKNVTMSDAIRDAILEKIENEFDLKAFNEIMQDYSNGQKRISHDEAFED